MAVIKVGRDDLRDRDMAVSELKEYFLALSSRKGRDITYNVRTYGCQLNESDSEKLSGMLASFRSVLRKHLKIRLLILSSLIPVP